MLIYLCILVLICALLSFTIKIAVEIKLDVLKNEGSIRVKNYFVKIFARNFHFDFENMRMVFKKEIPRRDRRFRPPTHNKAQPPVAAAIDPLQLNISANKKDKKSIAALLYNPIFKNLRVSQMYVNTHVGVASDAFITVMLLGALRIALHSGFAYMRTNFNTAIFENSISEFNQNRLDVNGTILSYISIGDMVFGIIILVKHKILNILSRVLKALRKTSAKNYG